MIGSSQRPRTVAAVRAGVGALMATRPDLAAQLLGARRQDAHPVLRLLGLRHLAEALAILLRPTPGMVEAGVAVDSAHVLSCVLLAAASRSHRQPALRDGAVASSVLLGTWLTRPRAVTAATPGRRSPWARSAPASSSYRR